MDKSRGVIGMKKLKFTICCPKKLIPCDALGISNGQQKTFYDNLKIALDDMGYESEFIDLTYKVPKTFNGDICFVFHTRVFGHRKDMWCVTDSNVFNYWSIDQRGWAGWSKMANSEEEFKKSQKVDLNTARIFFEQFSSNYIKNNMSKYKQPVLDEKLKVKEPYLFFPGQIIQDSVVRHHGKIDPKVHVDQISKHLIANGYNVLFKKHPSDRSGVKSNRPRISVTTNNPQVMQFSGSIHDAIPDAAGVIVIISGVGFESLLYKKHVFVSGHCDYHWIAHKIYSVDDIKKIPEILKTPVDEDKIIKFVYYMLTEIYVDKNNIDSIKKKITEVVKVYEDSKRGVDI